MTAEYTEKDFDSLWLTLVIAIFAGQIIGVPIIEWFNEVNPWIILEWPATTSTIIIAVITYYIRRYIF